MELRIGCSGWSYTSWVGPFYPKGTPQNRWLESYSKVFDYVEIDSTFYSIPSPIRTKKWARSTQEHFRFTAKIPKVITHDKAFYDIDRELDFFSASMAELKDKLLCVLIQLPPSISYKGGMTSLKKFMKVADPRFRYALEVRHKSWFNDEFYKFLNAENIALVWNQLDAIQAPPVVTADFVYFRLIGDRSIREQDFGTIQKDRVKEMQAWADVFKKIPQSVKTGIVAANNHYAGFGPGTATLFMKMMGLEPPARRDQQRTITEFGAGQP